jgi:hypothetical protein
VQGTTANDGHELFLECIDPFTFLLVVLLPEHVYDILLVVENIVQHIDQ